MMRHFFWLCCTLLLAGCGFHLQNDMRLSPSLHQMYLQTPDPYGQLARNLREYLKMSNVTLTTTPQEAKTTLNIISDNTSQHLLSVNGTLQTRQYDLIATIVFEINDANGQTIIPPQTLTEHRAMTVQSNEILGSSNEANLFFQQMHRSLAYALINRISSQEITNALNTAIKPTPGKKKR